MFEPDEAQRLALEAWHPKDHPSHLDPLHPAIGLAGEAGKLLDLYKKERFKGGVSWWDCVCGHEKHNQKMCNTEMNNPNLWAWDSNDVWCTCEVYTPKILDKLGGLWYYLGILAYQQEQDLSEWMLDKKRISPNDMFMLLSNLNFHCAKLLVGCEWDIGTKIFEDIFRYFQDILFLLNYTLPELTKLNHNKLKDGDHHGWQSARQSQK